MKEKASEKKEGVTLTEKTAKIIETEFEDNEKELEEKVEAVLFISGRFLRTEEIKSLTDSSEILLKSVLNNLAKKYSKGALRILNRGDSWKMDVSEKYRYLVNKLASGKKEFTKAEQETLAVIAYKQPIKQSVVVRIRGNKAYDHIKKFIELGLINAKKTGHTNELSLSEEFYEYFSVHKKNNQDNE